MGDEPNPDPAVKEGKAPAEEQYRESAIRRFFRRENWVAVGTLITGVAIGIGMPLWRTYVVEAPDLKLEIESFHRALPRGIPISMANPDFAFLREEKSFWESSIREITLQQTLAAIREPSQNTSDLIVRNMLRMMWDEEVEEDQPVTLAVMRQILVLAQSEITSLASQRREALADFNRREEGDAKEEARNVLDTDHKELMEFRAGVTTAKRSLATMSDEYLKTKGIFTLSALLTNSGNSGISIRDPALLRVYIGAGNYVELELRSNQLGQLQEIPAHTSKIMSFVSQGMDKLLGEHRKQVNRYYGQRANAILFVEDIFGKVQFSNRIQFAEGLYHQRIVDRLKKEASRNEHYRRSD